MATKTRRALFFAAAVAWVLSCAPPGAVAETSALEAVRTREHVICGVTDGPEGYSSVNGQGQWSGISVDFCRALAAAVIGSKDAVKFRLLSASERFAALQSGEIDVLSRNVAMTASRDTTLGIRFPGVLVYDGQGFLVRKSQGVSSALELSGARICVTTETADEAGVADFFASRRMPFELSRFETWQDAAMAYINKSCQVLSGDISQLALARRQLADPTEHIILPEIAAKRFIGPAVRQGDDEWLSVVRWTLYALIAAEELGITAANVETMKASGNPEVRRFLTADLDFGNKLGLSTEWAQRIVKQVGNYGELFDRHLGAKSVLKLERRLNNLWSNGGLQHAPSFR